MKSILILLSMFVGSAAQAATSNQANLIAIGQGISSPTLTSTVNFSSGYTNESPVGVIYQSSWRVAGEYDTDNDDDSESTGKSGYGAEVGYGNGTAGLAVGYYTRDCDTCDGRFAGSVGVEVVGIGVGLRFQEDLYTAALLFNPNGNHRFGLIAEMNGDNGEGNDLNSYGAGYSYVASQWTFTIDASKRYYENEGTYADRFLLTPGLMVRASFLQLSVNDKITFNNRETSTSDDDDTDHDLWVGLGVGGDSWHLAGYSNYVNDIAIALNFFF